MQKVDEMVRGRGRVLPRVQFLGQQVERPRVLAEVVQLEHRGVLALVEVERKT